MKNCLTSDYKIASNDCIEQINLSAASIVKELNIRGKVKKLHQKSAFLTIKDHKRNFPNSIECRLINTMKLDIGRIAKKILDKINFNIKLKTNLTQWKNSFEVIDWFNNCLLYTSPSPRDPE